jgi:hypothetical protein
MSSWERLSMPLVNRYFIWAPAPRCSKRDALFPSLLCLPPLHFLEPRSRRDPSSKPPGGDNLSGDASFTVTVPATVSSSSDSEAATATVNAAGTGLAGVTGCSLSHRRRSSSQFAESSAHLAPPSRSVVPTDDSGESGDGQALLSRSETLRGQAGPDAQSKFDSTALPSQAATAMLTPSASSTSEQSKCSTLSAVSATVFDPVKVFEQLHSNHVAMLQKNADQAGLRTLWRPVFYCQSDGTAASILRGGIDAKSALSKNLAALPSSSAAESAVGDAPDSAELEAASSTRETSAVTGSRGS